MNNGNSPVWDKTFQVSDEVTVDKVTYKNRYGIDIAADLYLPKKVGKNTKLPAVIIGPPYGGVRQQGPGVYANQLAERGFAALAFDPSFNGESGGSRRHIASPEIFVEDFSAGVDFMGTRPFVDREKIAVIGICGSGGFSIAAAQVDTRIKAVVTASMYDITRVASKGFMDSLTAEQRSAMLAQMNAQRYVDFLNGAPAMGPNGAPENVDENTNPIGREFYDYYYTNRGHHPNATSRFSITSGLPFMNFALTEHIASISPRPIMFIIGENAHSRYFSEDLYKVAADPKELVVIPGANHVELYDCTDKIPFDRIETFLKKAFSN